MTLARPLRPGVLHTGALDALAAPGAGTRRRAVLVPPVALRADEEPALARRELAREEEERDHIADPLKRFDPARTNFPQAGPVGRDEPYRTDTTDQSGSYPAACASYGAERRRSRLDHHKNRRSPGSGFPPIFPPTAVQNWSWDVPRESNHQAKSRAFVGVQKPGPPCQGGRRGFKSLLPLSA